MRHFLFFVVGAATLAATGARATSVSVSALPPVTGAPLLDIDAVVQDVGAVFVENPNSAVLVTITGSGTDGGSPTLPDGGTSSAPLVSPLTLVSFGSDGGTFTAAFAGLTPLFVGNNTVIVSAIRPNGVRFDSAPQTVRLDQSLGGGSDAGVVTDGGVPSDAGVLLDGGVQSSRAALTSESGGCSTTDSGPPSFFLMALTVMLAALGRRGLRS
jgi:uncharacterized protein (TIGR03382 family)